MSQRKSQHKPNSKKAREAELKQILAEEAWLKKTREMIKKERIALRLERIHLEKQKRILESGNEEEILEILKKMAIQRLAIDEKLKRGEAGDLAYVFRRYDPPAPQLLLDMVKAEKSGDIPKETKCNKQKLNEDPISSGPSTSNPSTNQETANHLSDVEDKVESDDRSSGQESIGNTLSEVDDSTSA